MKLASLGRRASTFQGALSAMLAVLGLAVLTSTGAMDVGPDSTDAMADWVVTHAYFDGADPYEPISSLSARYGVAFTSPIPGGDSPHPRLPGALIVLSPLLALSAEGANDLLRVSGVAAVVAISAVYGYWVDSRTVLIAALPGLLTLTAAAIWGFAWFTQSPLLALPVACAGLLAYRKRHLTIAVLLIALSAVLKPVLLIILVAFWRTGSRREASIGLSAFVSLNLVGLAVGRVGLVDVYEALNETTAAWFSTGPNLSAASWLNQLLPIGPWWLWGTATALVGGVLWLTRRFRGLLHVQMAVWACVGLLISPLSWPHYLLMVIPLIWLVLASSSVGPAPRVLVALGFLPWIWAQAPGRNFVGLLIITVGCFAATRAFTPDAEIGDNVANWSGGPAE